MTDRTPTVCALIHRDWYDDWQSWSSVGDRYVVVWVEDLPLVDEGDEVDLTYFGPVEGDTAAAFDAPIDRIEPAHGGFHIAFDAGEEFVEQLGEPSDDVEVIEA